MPPPHGPAGPPAPTSAYRNADELLTAIASDRNGVLKGLETKHQGALQFADGRQFKIAYAGRNVRKLEIARQHAQGTSAVVRCLYAVADALWLKGDVRRIQSALDNIEAMAQSIAQDLKRDFKDIENELWPDGGLDMQVQDGEAGLDSRSILPWLASRDPDSPFQRSKFQNVKSLGDSLLVATFSHKDQLLEIRFRQRTIADSMRQEQGPGNGRNGRLIDIERAQRDVGRMRDLLEGKYEKRLGAYRNPRELMQQFMRVRLEQEARTMLENYAAQGGFTVGARTVPRARPDFEARKYAFVPRTREGNVAHNGNKAIALAVRQCMAHFEAFAAQRSTAQPLDSTALMYRPPEHTVLDKHTNRALETLVGHVRPLLRSHTVTGFARALRSAFGVTTNDQRLIKRYGGKMGGDPAMVEKGKIPKQWVTRAAEFDVPNGTAALRYCIKLPWWQAIFRSRSTAPDEARPDRVEPSTTVAKRGKNPTVAVRGCCLLVEKYPAPLRFPLGSVRDGWPINLPELATGKKHKSLSDLFKICHRSIHDEYLHTMVLPSADAIVDTAAAGMRDELRAGMHDVWAAEAAAGGNVEIAIPRESQGRFIDGLISLATARADARAACAARDSAQANVDAWTRLNQAEQVAADRRLAKVDEAVKRDCAMTGAQAEAQLARVRLLLDQLVPLVPEGYRQAAGDALRDWIDDRDVVAPDGEAGAVVAAARAMSDLVDGFEADVVVPKELTLRERLSQVRIGGTTLSELWRWRDAERQYAGLANAQRERARAMLANDGGQGESVRNDEGPGQEEIQIEIVSVHADDAASADHGMPASGERLSKVLDHEEDAIAVHLQAALSASPPSVTALAASTEIEETYVFRNGRFELLSQNTENHAPAAIADGASVEAPPPARRYASSDTSRRSTVRLDGDPGPSGTSDIPAT